MVVVGTNQEGLNRKNTLGQLERCQKNIAIFACVSIKRKIPFSIIFGSRWRCVVRKKKKKKKRGVEKAFDERPREHFTDT